MTGSTLVESYSSLVHILRTALALSVERNLGGAILLSGGLDTSIIAGLASRSRPPRAYTVALEGAPSPDLYYAELMAKKLHLSHTVHVFSLDELMGVLPRVVRTLGVFDPMEVRNSVAIFVGLQQAESNGALTVLTGDGCDELFAGYSFLFNLTPHDLKRALEKLWRGMQFSSVPMAKSLGIEAKLPFLDPAFRQIATHVDPSLLVAEQNGQKWGKWIVRKAFEDLLPDEITWRVKTPIEYGCGTTTLPQIFDRRIPDGEFHEKQRRIKEADGVNIRDKEHLVYYEKFRRAFGARAETTGRTCPQCQYEVGEDATFCRTCGAYPI